MLVILFEDCPEIVDRDVQIRKDASATLRSLVLAGFEKLCESEVLWKQHPQPRLPLDAL